MANLLARVRDFIFGSKQAAPPAQAPSPPELRATYDLAQTTRDNARQWAGADWLDADASDSPGVRHTLRNRSRHEVQNNPTLTGICRTVCDYEIGTGPTLHIDHEDEDFAAEVEEKWSEWCEAVNLVGKLRQMVYGRVVDGEAFARLGQNPNLKNDVQLDIQPFECDRCFTLWLPYLTPYRIDGIWFDTWGNPTYYDILQYHPGGVFPMPTWKFDTTPAQFVLHLFNPERANQHRGIPEMMSSTDLWADRRRHRKATVAAAESAANVAAFLTTNQPAQDFTSAHGQMEMPRNSLVVAPQGYDMRQVDAKHPNQTYEAFSTETLSEAARPMSMAKNVAKCDSSSYNFAGGRIDIVTSWKAVENNQRNNTYRAVNPTFRAWYVEARLVYDWAEQGKDGGTIPNHHFLWVGMPYSDPEAEQSADEAAIRTGLKGIQEVYTRRGKDWRIQRRMNAKALGMRDEEYLTFVTDNLRGGKAEAIKEPPEIPDGQPGETPEKVKAKFARMFPGLAKRLNGRLHAKGFDESKHPRGQPENSGEFGPGGSSGGTATKTRTKTGTKPASKPSTQADIHDEPDRPVKLKKVSQRAFSGQPIATKTQLGKSATGKLAENIVIGYCKQVKGRKDARHLNLDRNNFPIDLVQDHESIEVKGGLVSNRMDAQRWRLTIGEPGKAEKEWLAKASDKDKAAWNARKQQAIIERKAKCLKNLSKELGKPVKAKTMTVIINPDTKTADIYEFDGWHDRIGWRSAEAKAAYVGSVQYE